MSANSKGFWRMALGLAGGLLGAGTLALVSGGPRGASVNVLAAPSPPALLVHVSGAVAAPDVVALPPGSRVQDAITAAGGLLETATTEDLNLAAAVSDGQKIVVPYLPTPTPVGYVPPTAAGPPDATLAVGFPLNLNTASYEELLALPGIGPVRAQAILDYRAANGPFTRVEQVMNVPGIGPATFDDLQGLIEVGEG